MSDNINNEKEEAQNEFNGETESNHIVINLDNEDPKEETFEKSVDNGDKPKDTIIDIVTEKQNDAFEGAQRDFMAYENYQMPPPGQDYPMPPPGQGYQYPPGQQPLPPYNYADPQQGMYPQYGAPPPPTTPATMRGVLTYQPGRNAFVRHVFMLVFIMLAITAAVTVFVYTSDLRNFMTTRLAFMLLLVCMIAMIAIVCGITLECSKRAPVSYLLLMLSVVVMSFICACFTAMYAPHIVISSLLTTTAISFICLGLSCTNIDFTSFLLLVIVASFALFFSSMIALSLALVFNVNITIARIIILVLGSIVTSMMLIMEFQMIIGGRTVELSEDEYAYAAILVYMSILDLFLKCLGIQAFAAD